MTRRSGWDRLAGGCVQERCVRRGAVVNIAADLFEGRAMLGGLGREDEERKKEGSV